ncbi:hypothetical protein [Cognatiluteimonas telluris]|jgi:hypothetical protein|uniref:hypothetical protein n=1 Tax=Cognatiluteimonas telluris TaxID=1104775 RepID=UPI001A9CAACD|nr:hypothetical protein [Lysobacter telluris]
MPATWRMQVASSPQRLAAVSFAAMPVDDRAFASFLQQYVDDLDAIAGWSRGELTPGDVRNEAWIQAFDLGGDLGRRLDLEDTADATLLLQRLRRHCDRLRRTSRGTCPLDQPLGGPEGPTRADFLADDDGAHPLSLLEAIEEEVVEPEFPGPRHSELAAWHWLALRFDRRMPQLADYLLISVSWCHARRRRARRRAVSQWPLAQALQNEIGTADEALRPWRRFKLPPRHRPAANQLGLDYWCRPSQPMEGQLWLL